MADENAFQKFIWAEAAKLREGDVSLKTRAEWEIRRKTLLEKMAQALGPAPEKSCDLEPRNLGTLERDGYRIEKIVFQSRPDVWMTANAYVPALKDGQKVPAVLVVHGHWAGARRDPVVQARCLGLVKIGFFVLAVDAFGAGERYTKPAKGTYHGALYGATLWPTGHSLLGMQVYDNRRAIDYLLTRKEVNGKFGITGASGGGNQSMNAGALDDRIHAVVPVCSVGNYQSYLRTACCVCEVLPGALKFTEEGDVLGLEAPRALFVMNASRDGIQFSPAEAEKSLARAKDIYKLLGEESKVKHQVFDSGHDYNKAMREAMYGWMTLHLKGEGKGEPIPEPAHMIEKPEDLACYPDPNDRPKGFLTPPLFAGNVGRELVAKIDKLAPTHPEMWEATANLMRAELKSICGDLSFKSKTEISVAARGAIIGTQIGTIEVEPGFTIPFSSTSLALAREHKTGTLHIHTSEDEKPEAKPPVTRELDKLNYHLMVALRGTGCQHLKGGAIAGAPDHHFAEYGVWIGRPMLGQWTVDTLASITVLRRTVGDKKPLALLGDGPIALVAICAAGFTEDGPVTVVLRDPIVSLVTDTPYASGTPMGILAPGILKVGDIPHLAGLIAPRRLVIAGGVSPQGKKLSQKELEEAFRFTTAVYKAIKAPEKLTIVAEPDWGKIDL
jgi:dienelactone hydrolase